MKTKFHISAIAALFIFGTVSCATKSSVVQVPISSAEQSASKTLFNEVNAYRIKKGKTPLIQHDGLQRLAQGHAEFLRDNRGKFSVEHHQSNVSHYGFDGRTAIAKAKYNMYDIHENVGSGANTTEISQAWFKSKAHELAITEKWIYSGVGVVIDKDGRIFATQLFGNAETSHLALQQKFGAF